MLGLGESFLNSTVKMKCKNLNCPCSSGNQGVFNKSHQLLAWVYSDRLLFRRMINSLGLYNQPDGVRLFCNHDGSFFGLWWTSEVKLETVIGYALGLEGAFSVYKDEMLYQFARDFQLCRKKALGLPINPIY